GRDRRPSTTDSAPSRRAWTRSRRSREATRSTRSRSRFPDGRLSFPLQAGAYNRVQMPFHPLWLVLILVVVLIVFGPGRLPELGGAVGKAMREFRKATTELTNEVTSAAQAKPETPAPAESVAKAPTSTSPEADTSKN